ncbi:MAG: sulfite exporter TauE/SafE family protein, partial [Chitinophagia bacterium]|nr:sulfite exporter TauE/SafE family protein [Chitinophagia bacterium]
MAYWQIALLFLGVSFIYASVGFGGGSSYLAVLALAGFQVYEMKLIALVCNIVVVSGGTFLY